MKATKRRNRLDVIRSHPCFSREAHHRFGRIHLPVAPACNIQCRYCIRKYDCANESRPGVSSRVYTAPEALERVRLLVERGERISVIGIAGPGDPLANDVTFEVLGAIGREFPELILCVSTNGLALPERLDALVGAGVRSLTITINAVVPETAEEIYSRVSCNGMTYTGRAAADVLLSNQWRGLCRAVEAGLIVKVNTVLIPGVNDQEIPYIAWLAGRRGAAIHNIIPLIPQAEFEGLRRPTRAEINRLRDECRQYMPQMTHCRQCRADAFGGIGEDRDMELEVINAMIGEEYCEMVS